MESNDGSLKRPFLMCPYLPLPLCLYPPLPDTEKPNSQTKDVTYTAGCVVVTFNIAANSSLIRACSGLLLDSVIVFSPVTVGDTKSLSVIL